MKKSNFIKKIVTDLNNVVSIVSKPDHPYLFSAPDLLLADSGKLTAAFLPNKTEIKYPDKLLVRLAISRLALPVHMRCVLLLNDDQEYEDHIFRNFDEVIGEKEYENLVPITHDNRKDYTREKHLGFMQKKTYIRSNFMFIQSTKGLFQNKDKESIWDYDEFLITKIDLKNDFIVEPVLIPSWSSRRSRVGKSRKIFNYEDSNVAEVYLKRERSKLQKLKPYFEASVKLHYELDNGIPYISHDFTPNILVTDEYPLGRSDILKPLRTAAFSGWMLYKFRGLDDFEKLVKNLNKQIPGELNERW